VWWVYGFGQGTLVTHRCTLAKLDESPLASDGNAELRGEGSDDQTVLRDLNSHRPLSVIKLVGGDNSDHARRTVARFNRCENLGRKE
jgi:hypothetical protein